MVDVVFANPNSSQECYQELAEDVAAIEVPVWSLLLAQSCRSKGYSVEILDCDAERLSDETAIRRISDCNPRLVCFVTYGANPNSGTQNMSGTLRLAKKLKEHCPYFTTLSIGSHTSALPEWVLNQPGIDFVSINEGVYTLHDLLELLKTQKYPLMHELEKVRGLGFKRIIFENGQLSYFNQQNCTYHLNDNAQIVPQSHLDIDLPGMAWDLLPYKNSFLDLYRCHVWHNNYDPYTRSPFAAMYSSLGCVKKCLHGDTLINTIYGKIKIKDIYEKYRSIPVYTYCKNTKKLLISNAINISKTGINKKLVRVEFDDGSYIDCTPDHKFLIFTTANQYKKSEEIEVEAQYLTTNMRVRALNEYIYPKKYRVITCGSTNYYNGRLVLEYKLGRELTSEEEVHHIDENKINDCPDNLILCSTHIDHLKYHTNPHKYWTLETRKKLSDAIKLARAKPEIKLKYREANLGIKNPNYKHGKRSETSSKISDEVNHKIVKVTELSGLHDTYCMEVPGYNWFFANDVLVHNCSFCMINIVNRTNIDSNTNASYSPIMRYFSTNWINKQLDYLTNQGVRNIRFSDELFFLNRKHYEPILDSIIEKKQDINWWSYTRVDTVKEAYLEKFRKAGCNYLGVGIEAGNQKIRQEIDKGRFEDVNVREISKRIENAGINRGFNYIFGFENEKLENLQETFDLSVELGAELNNYYAAVALPGSPLYFEALKQGWVLPATLDGFGFLSYNHLPMRTHHLTAAEVLKFRDEAWHKYFESPKYLNMIEGKFGKIAREHIEKIYKIKLKRKILGD